MSSVQTKRASGVASPMPIRRKVTSPDLLLSNTQVSYFKPLSQFRFISLSGLVLSFIVSMINYNNLANKKMPFMSQKVLFKSPKFLNTVFEN